MRRLLISVLTVIGFLSEGAAFFPPRLHHRAHAHIITRATPCALHNQQFPNDGCGGGIAFTLPQKPSLFAPYKRRPPWPVAGVDYRVGASGQFNDPTGPALPGCASYSAGVVTVNSAPCTLDHFDFSGHGGVAVIVPTTTNNGANFTFTNNRMVNLHFQGVLSLGALTIKGIVNANIQYNTIDTMYSTGANDPSYNIYFATGATGNATIKYNDLYHCWQACITTANEASVIITNNYIEGIQALNSGAHGDFWIANNFTAGTYSLTSKFNTVNVEKSSGNLMSTADCYMTNNLTTQYYSFDCENETIIERAGHTLGGYLTRMNPFGQAVTVATSSPAFTWTSNTLTANQQIVLSGTAVPTGLSFGVTYYARDILTNTFNVASSPGGAAIIPSGTGTSVVATSQGPYTLSNNYYDSWDSGAGAGSTTQILETDVNGAMANVTCKGNVDLTTGLAAIVTYTGPTTPFTSACTP